eukprot:15438001-Alexandrium_andersonii.AAC.1
MAISRVRHVWPASSLWWCSVLRLAGKSELREILASATGANSWWGQGQGATARPFGEAVDRSLGQLSVGTPTQFQHG